MQKLCRPPAARLPAAGGRAACSRKAVVAAASNRPAQQHRVQQQQQEGEGMWQAGRLQALGLAGVILASALSPAAAFAADLPFGLESGSLAALSETQKQKLDAAEEAFQQSDTLKRLLEASAANKAKNKKEIENKYCYRQAELGIGDCGGLRYIPGMTQSGKQKTPQWLADALGVDVPEGPKATAGKTLSDLLNGGEGGAAE